MEDPRISSPAEHRPSFALPSIRVRDTNPHNAHHHPSPHSSFPIPARQTGPMSIPNNTRPSAPPALPPPKHIDEDDFGWWYANKASGGKSTTAPVSPSSSLAGSQTPRQHREQEGLADFARRCSTTATDRSPSTEDIGQRGVRHPDEGYASLSVRSRSSQKLQGEESQRNAFLQRSTQAYDNSLLQKIDSARSDHTARNPNPSPRNFQPPVFRCVEHDASSGQNLLKPLAIPTGMNPTDSPGKGRLRLASVSDLAVSPRHNSYDVNAQSYSEYRDVRREIGSVSSVATEPERPFPGYDAPSGRSHSMSMYTPYDNANSFASRSQRGSCGHGGHHEHEEETGLRHLNLGERTPPRRGRYSPESKVGQKRRASSPPRDPDSVITWNNVGNGSDLFQRRASGHLSAERKPSVPRLHDGSVSSASSMPRTASLASSAGLSLAASSATSVSSYDRLSPRGPSPTSELDSHDSPYANSGSVHPSPRGSVSRAPPRNLADVKGAPAARKSSIDDAVCPITKPRANSKIQSVYICECCPKKPKKFDNMADLETHRREKQYTCQYCHNRFKNKNEAERHQNSLHLRRHSWSCNALSGVEAAFHSSPLKPCLVDICGYCGEEFPNPPNIDVRAEHLTTVHKFGECNHSKKFFRADHFRQHLKHSHAGTSGKWTNMLETACMKDEPAPERVNSVSESVGRINEEAEE